MPKEPIEFKGWARARMAGYCAALVIGVAVASELPLMLLVAMLGLFGILWEIE